MQKAFQAALIAICFGLLSFGCLSVATAQVGLPADPLGDPKASFDTITALTKLGWPITVLGIVIMLSRVAVRLSPRFEFLRGKVATFVAGVLAIATAAFDVLALGGSWGSVVMAAAFAALALWDANQKKQDGN